MVNNSIESKDKLERRCPMLGHPLSFKYCRKTAKGIPCKKIIQCWWEDFDINEFLNENFSKEELLEILKPSKTKVSSLLDLIEQAKKTIK